MVEFAEITRFTGMVLMVVGGTMFVSTIGRMVFIEIKRRRGL